MLMHVFRRSVVFVLAALAAAWSLGPPAEAQAAPALVRAAAPELRYVARGVPMGGALRVFDLQLDSGNAQLELQRFAVFAPDATVEVVGGPATAIPDTAYFRGRTAADPNSIVMLAVPARGKGKIHGVVTGAAGNWMLESIPGKAGLRTRKVDAEADFAGRVFECGSDGSKAKGAAALAGAAAAASFSTSPLTVTYTAHAIIDTDVEFWERFWNLPGNTGNPAKTAAAAIEYVGDLLAYASSMYEREVDTNLLISSTRLFAGAADTDPYSENDDACGCTGTGKLDEVQSVWSGNATPRTFVHFISGKTEGCGCAYIGVLCSQASGYGASSGIGTAFDIDDPGFVWEGMVIAHEIGHNFNSPHTHQYCGEAGISDPVDVCVDTASDGVANCLGNNNAALPGLGTLSGGTAGAQNGTIMSYCHQRGGGFANFAHTFGQYHPFGRAAYRVPDKMLAHVQASAGCMSLDYTGSDLRVTKDCKPDDPIAVGGTATCTVTVENLGGDNALAVVVDDQFLSDGTFTIAAVTATRGGVAMPAGTCVASANPQAGSGSVTCNIDAIDAGHVVVIQVPVSATTPQNINDRVTVSSDSPDSDPTNNVAEDEVNVVQLAADLAVTKLCKPDGLFYAGGPDLPYCEITVTNLGPETASGVYLVDRVVGSSSYWIQTVVADADLADSCVTTPGLGSPTTSSDVTCMLSDPLPQGGKWTVRVVYSADEATDINDQATVTATTTDANTGNNLATGSVQVASSANLAITKSDSTDPVTAGNSLTYTITVTNNGPSQARNVKVVDAVPAGVVIQSVTPSVGSCTAGVAGDASSPTRCSLGNMADAAVATVTIVVNVSPETRGVLLNSATASSDTYDVNAADNTAAESTTVDAVAALQVTKVDTPDPVLAGDSLYYTIGVTNNGPSTASNVQLVDKLPALVTYVSGVDGNGNTVCTLSPGSIVTCNLGSLGPQASTQVFLTGKVASSAAQGSVLTNTADVTTPEDTDGANASATTTVDTAADVWIDKIQNYPTGNPSGTIVYTLTAMNRPGCESDDQLTCWDQSGGPSDAQDVVVTDPLPWTPKILIVQYVAPGCTYDVTTHTVTCNAGTLEYGQSATFRIEAVVKGSKGAADNIASVQTSTNDPESANNSDKVSTLVKGGTGKTGGRGGR